MASDEVAPTDTRTGKFLEVEEMARSLASRLARLDEEADRFDKSAALLSETAQATRELVAVVRAVADDSAKALSIVASVGGPELVKRLAAMDAKHSTQAQAALKRLTLVAILASVGALGAVVSTALLFLAR